MKGSVTRRDPDAEWERINAKIRKLEEKRAKTPGDEAGVTISLQIAYLEGARDAIWYLFQKDAKAPSLTKR